MSAKASFLSLPGELRNAIYEDVAASALSTIHIHHGKVVLPALAFTCKQTWKEMASMMRHSKQLATAEIHAEVLNFDCHKVLDFLTRFDRDWSGTTPLRPVRLTLSFSAFTSQIERATGLVELMTRMQRAWELDVDKDDAYTATPKQFFDVISGSQWAIRLCWSKIDDAVPVNIGSNRFMLTWRHYMAHNGGWLVRLPGLDYARDIGILVEGLGMSLSAPGEDWCECDAWCHKQDQSPFEAMMYVADDFGAVQQQRSGPALSVEEQLELQRKGDERNLMCHEQNAKEPFPLAAVGRRNRRLAEQDRVISGLVASMSRLSMGV